ncbi:hypothetical protein [Kocuria sp. CNJ-770]|uniref:hypothetical protein n=1 Tax=Kocuria sp. CNJ-770 TaxID=1904964 RepID=UPI00210197A8|nr:hypothetical protein [Kocuria sp. CNJ-770]
MTDAAAAVVSRFAASTEEVDGAGGRQETRELPLGPATADQGQGPRSAVEELPAL